MLPVFPFDERRIARQTVGDTRVLRRLRAMATILLVGEDLTDRENLAAKLRIRGHDVVETDYSELPLVSWNAHMASAEIAILDVTNVPENGKRQVRSICQQPRQDGFPALVLCYSRTYCSPRFELDIERLGARFVYAE
jgi:hypothetical protein